MGETDYYVIVDKPALLDSQNSKESRYSVVDWLNEKFQFSGLVHRLDFGTSGLMVCAKNADAARRLTLALQRGEVSRVYQAVVLGNILPDQGEFTAKIGGQSALTHFKMLERFANAALVEVDLETGRKHQIRRHFSDAGHPLLGDHLYGKRGAARLFTRPALHACKLTVQGRVYKAPAPHDFQELLARFRLSKAKRS